MTIMSPGTFKGYLRIIHNDYRTALLNKKYYACRLSRYLRINKCMEILIAIGATTGTGIAGFAIWQQGAGVTAWGIISGLSIVLSTLKPIIDVPKQIERCAKLAGEYASLFETL